MTRGLLAIVFLGLAGAIFFLYTKPSYDTITEQQTKIAQYDQALDKAAQLQQLKQALLSRYNAFDPNDVDRLQKMLPDHVDNIGLILDLNSLASQHGMSLENVDVTNTGSAATDSTSASATIGSNQQDYESLTLRFTTHSTYPNFETFMRNLEASLRIVDLVSLSITTGGGSGVGGATLYQYQVTIKTYWLK
ncbi:type 4a pilus biogenesis protein PilO [Candidatus Kaiserbacteria bacterium]|nr:type 4a pilus biogenesis protein PilO [Candidatus Kaiserbacteria bacterium]